MQRCEWAENDELLQRYHDKEWGVPLYDDQKLFEFLMLDGFQAGLSWLTILQKRENFRRAFDNFNVEKIASYSASKLNALLNDNGIIRNRLKIKAAVTNARAYLDLRQHERSFSEFIWHFVGGQPIVNHYSSWQAIPARSKISEKMSSALKKYGFTFVGPTICYAFMQAAGLVNDHIVDCFRHQEVQQLNKKTSNNAV